MQILCKSGFKISDQDKKVLEYFLLETPKEWAQKALIGMINKSGKTIFKDWFELYKGKQMVSISGDVAILIPAIIAMEEFKNYNQKVPELELQRENLPTEEIWEGGFDLEDYQYNALNAYYQNPEEMLRYFMENKIYQRRKRFIEENQQGFLQRKETMPVKQDDFINLVCSKTEYKNRKQRDEEDGLI